MDHIGRIPKLAREGFKGPIYSTEATKELAAATFDDAVKIMATEAREIGKEPLYKAADVVAAFGQWKTLPYHEALELSPGVSFVLKDSGHILGSAIVEFSIGARKAVFTGDLGNSPSILLPDTEVIDDAEYMVMESVYGDRNHEPAAERDKRLETTLAETLSNGGTVVIPAFSIERTQDLLFSIGGLFKNGSIPSVPVFLDSPLALKVTYVYENEYGAF